MKDRQPRPRKLGREALLKRVSGSIAPHGVTASEIAAENHDGTERQDGADEEQSTTHGLSRWFPRVTLALSAFIMSLVVTLISAYYALQGPEVLVRPPEQVLLYRDGEGDQSILGFGVRLDMINGASDYGDVMLDAELTPVGSGASFHFQNVMRSVFTGSAPVSDECELGSRCIAHPGLRLIEQPDTLVDLAGGAARAMHLSFPAAQWNCDGSEQACARYATFDQALAALATRRLEISIKLNFNRDGNRTIRCSAGRIDANYVRQLGWATLACDDSSVSGGPWL